MDWIKVKCRHAEYDLASASAEVFKTWILVMVYVASTERKPLDLTLDLRYGAVNMKALKEHLHKCETDLDFVIEKVLEDVEKVLKKQGKDRRYMRKYRSKPLRKALRNPNVKGKSRVDKIRVDKSIYNIIPPSLSDLETYIKEQRGKFTAQQFTDFYEARGWMVGKNKMKNWQACVRTWISREEKPRAVMTPTGLLKPGQRLP